MMASQRYDVNACMAVISMDPKTQKIQKYGNFNRTNKT